MIASVADYRQIIRDLASYDGDISRALVEAQDYFTSRTGRIIELGTYNETLAVSDDGQVFPAATPIQSVIDPSSVTFDTISVQVFANWNVLGYGGWYGSAYGGYYGYGPYGVGGYAGYGAYGHGYHAPGVLTGMDKRPARPRFAITYVGGYQTPPADVVRCVCEMAGYVLHPDFAFDVPTGATSIRLGDQSVTGKLTASSQMPASVNRIIAAYTREDLL